MTNTMSRRSILARGAAGTAMAALPVVATAIASKEAVAGLESDAELLTLGRQVDALYPELMAAQEASSAAADAADAEVSRRLGFDINGPLTQAQIDKAWVMAKVYGPKSTPTMQSDAPVRFGKAPTKSIRR